MGTSGRRQKHETTDATRGEQQQQQQQDNQDKSDLQGKIQFYQQLCASQARQEATSSHCQFSTFKSSIADRTATDFAGLSLAHRKELGGSLRSHDHERRALTPTVVNNLRRLDNQSYFFHGHKTEKDVDATFNRSLSVAHSFCALDDDRGQSTRDSLDCCTPTADHTKYLTTSDEERNETVKFLSANSKSLDALPDTPPPSKSFFHAKQRSLDSTKKAKKRPSIFQRVGQSLHFFPRDRDRRSRLRLTENEARDKCKFFLQKGFLERTLPARDPVNNDASAEIPHETILTANEPSSQPLTTATAKKGCENDVNNDASRENKTASVTTHETTSGNKDSIEIGYSISQLGRCCQNKVIMTAYPELHNNKADLDVFTRRTNSTDFLANGKPQGNLDILKSILLDLFVCICT